MPGKKLEPTNVRNLFDLTGSVAVVTGGDGYLGYYISEALVEAGARVYLASRTEKKYKFAAKILQNRNETEIRSMNLDVRSMASIKECFNQIIRHSGKIDVLVNNANFISGKDLDMSESQWLEGLDGTVNGVYRTIKTVLPIMEKNRSGSIINIASMYGMVSPNPSIYKGTDFFSPPNYGAGKSAIIQLTRYAACYLAGKGVRVNAVSPGPFPSPEVQKDKLFISRLQSKSPLGRIGRPYEMKGAIVFLASKASSYITGINLPIDGGWTAW